MAYEMKKGFDIEENVFYLLKVRVEAPESIPGSATIRCSFLNSGREDTFSAPISSGKPEDYAIKGRWCEQYYLFKSGLTDKKLQLTCSCAEDCELSCSLSPWHIEVVDEEKMLATMDILKRLSESTTALHGVDYKVFPNCGSIAPELVSLRLSTFSLPPLNACGKNKKIPLKVGCWSDSLLREILDTRFDCYEISQETLPLIEQSFFDLIVVQERTAKQVDALGERFAQACAKSSTPIVIFESADTMDERIRVRSLRQDQVPLLAEGVEAEFLRIMPSARTANALTTIAVPCASDLYQFPHFQDTVAQLLRHEFKIILSECVYQNRPNRTLELFGEYKKNIKIYPKISLDEHISLFRECGFVILCNYSLRNRNDIISIAYAALMSGSIPILINFQEKKSEYIFYQCNSEEHALSYINKNRDINLFNKTWLSLFRKLFLKKELFSSCKCFIKNIGNYGLNTSDTCPPIDILCISKRPNNIDHIYKNFSRQTYKNKNIHLIWNVNHNIGDYCKNISKKIEIENIRISTIDDQYNIGYCLNHGIKSSSGKYWFKFDDDDYYGKHYIEDTVNMYSMTDHDALFKRSAFISFASQGDLYLRKSNPGNPAEPERYLRLLQRGEFACGATLSARKSPSIPLFSVKARNSCDSLWIESLWDDGVEISYTDYFNYCTLRQAPGEHTWKASEELLKTQSTRIGCFDEDWIDAD